MLDLHSPALRKLEYRSHSPAAHRPVQRDAQSPTPIIELAVWIGEVEKGVLVAAVECVCKTRPDAGRGVLEFRRLSTQFVDSRERSVEIGFVEQLTMTDLITCELQVVDLTPLAFESLLGGAAPSAP